MCVCVCVCLGGGGGVYWKRGGVGGRTGVGRPPRPSYGPRYPGAEIFLSLNPLVPKAWKKIENSIAFGSAPRREVDSQPFSPCARPAVSQTETRGLGFFSVADASPSSGATHHHRASSGRMVMQPITASLAAAAKSQQIRIRTTAPKLCVGCVTVGPA